VDPDHAALSAPEPAVRGRRIVIGSGWGWAAPAALLLVPFLLWPLGAMLWRGLTPDGALSGDAIADVLGDRFYWERLVFTTAQAGASTLLALLVGLPAAAALALYRFPGRGLVRAVITVPFVLPTIVVALAFQQVIGPGGWLNDLLGGLGASEVNLNGTIWAILLAHVFYNLSIVVRLVSGVWANLDPRREEAARLLGAGRWATFQRVTLPELAPAIAAAAALTFTFTFTSFGVILLLGGGRASLDTLEVTIFRLATRLTQLPEAAVLAMVQLAATLAALVVYSALQRRAATRVTLRADRAKPLARTSRLERALLAAVALGLGALIVAPIAALVSGALTSGHDGVTLANFGNLFEDTGRFSYIPPLDAVRWSLTFAAGSTLLAVVIGGSAGMAIARSRGRLLSLVDGALMLPLGIPAIVLGLGFLLTFNTGWYDLRGSPWLLLVAHALIAYPFVLRAVLAVARSIDPHLPEAARLLGASPWRVFLHVELPLLARALLVGAVFAFVISLGEFGATLLLRRREFATMPIAIFEALGRPGGLGQALAMATILMAVTAGAVWSIERFRFREIGEF
jgi:thiamine transport system permease protein